MSKIVVDLDETLFKSGKISYYLRTLAKILFKLSLRFQKPDKNLIAELAEYGTVIVLTARGDSYFNLTKKQLIRHGVTYDKIYMSNYRDLTMDWKKVIVFKEKPDKWVDDMKDYVPVGAEGY
jgi:hypothetical protein